MSQSGQSCEVFSPVPISKQKMIQELKDAGLFEFGMSTADMEPLMRMIQESKAVAGTASEESITESMELESTRQESLGSYSGALSNKLAKTSQRKSMSPVHSSTYTKMPSLEKYSDSSNEPSLSSNGKNVCYKEGKNSNGNKARNSNLKKTNEGTSNNKRTNLRSNHQTPQENKIPKNRLDPFDFVENPKDIPLVPLYRTIDNQDCNKGFAASDNSDKVIARLCNHLRQVSDIWHNQHGSSVETNFQWGTAIKVTETNEGIFNRITDGNEPLEFSDDNNQPQETSNSVVDDTATRRRRIITTKTGIYNYNDTGDDNEDNNNSDEDFQMFPKRKKIVASSSGKKVTSTSSTREKSVEPEKTGESKEKTSIENKRNNSSRFTDVLDEITITDDEKSGAPPKKVQRSNSEETEPVYPRRIVPPKAETKRFGIRARTSQIVGSRHLRGKKQAEEDEEEISRKPQGNKSSLGLRDTEIAEALEKDDENDTSDNNSVVPVSSDNTEFKPLRISARMILQSQNLVNLQAKEKEKEMLRRDQERMKEEAINCEKAKRIQQRIRDEQQKQEFNEQMERRKAQRQEFWNAKMAQRERERPVERTELYPDGKARINEVTAEAQENNVTMNQNVYDCSGENGFGLFGESEPETMPCPICNKSFTIEKIEGHAAACEEFDGSSPGVSRSDSPVIPHRRANSTVQRSGSSNLLECEICTNFTTVNGKEFENHMAECLRRQKYEQSHTPEHAIEVPSSPIRTVRTISEQTDSAINYKGQFTLKSKSNKTRGRKRKR